jgi:hypothetical protein
VISAVAVDVPGSTTGEVACRFVPVVLDEPAGQVIGPGAGELAVNVTVGFGPLAAIVPLAVVAVAVTVDCSATVSVRFAVAMPWAFVVNEPVAVGLAFAEFVGTKLTTAPGTGLQFASVTVVCTNDPEVALIGPTPVVVGAANVFVLLRPSAHVGFC